VETDPTRALAWMIGLHDVRFFGCEDGAVAGARIHVEMTAVRSGCPDCGGIAR
jgi:hypothetical protein